MSIKKIRAELRKHASPSKARVLRRFFKTGPGEYGEGDLFLGAMVPQTRAVAKRHRDLPLAGVRRLLKSKVHEERLLALLVLVDQYERAGEAGRNGIFRFYVRNLDRVNNWDLVDLSAPNVVGKHLLSRPKTPLFKLAASQSLWDRRVAVVACLTFIRQGRFVEIQRLARMLLKDPEDLMHKALGWMLREMGKRDVRVLERFLKREARRMPRTMLRYAIEKFPATTRKKYMKL